MPTKSKSKKEVVIEKPKRGRKKKVVPKATAEPVEESVPAPVPTPKKRVRKKKVKVSEEPPVVIEEVKEEKPKKTKKASKVEKKDESKKKRPPNKWLIHVKEFRSKNPDMKYSEVLKKAKDTYVK